MKKKITSIQPFDFFPFGELPRSSDFHRERGTRSINCNCKSSIDKAELTDVAIIVPENCVDERNNSGKILRPSMLICHCCGTR